MVAVPTTSVNNEIAAQIAAIADEQGVTVRFVAEQLKRNGMDGVTDELVAESSRILRDEVDSVLRRARHLNEGRGHVQVVEAGAKVQMVEAGAKVQVVVPKKERVMGKVIRGNILGYSATSVLRWMGANGWSFEDAAVVCAATGCARISDVTIRLQLKAGKDGTRGPAAPVTAAQAKKLVEMSK